MKRIVSFSKKEKKKSQASLEKAYKQESNEEFQVDEPSSTSLQRKELNKFNGNIFHSH